MSVGAELVRRWWEEVWNERRVELADEILAPEFVVHVRWSNPAFAGPRDVPGIEPTKEVIRTWARSFPDFRVSVDELMDGGEFISCIHTFTGTDSGTLEGRPGPPTGNAISMSGITVMRVGDGRIHDAWTCWDMVACLQQLGAIPPPGSGPLGLLRVFGANVTRVAGGKLRRRRVKPA